ncbi:MAG TPA: hypothetical protein VE086_08825 [Chthoniobacterales bacterium]|nr:hypothetical protein [Chthoniobacterales bacterium]
MIANRRDIAGAAIVIVLAFVVLLAAIVIAYLMRTSISRQVAHGDFNDAKSDQLARSALDIVVADFKEEIANGAPVTSANIGPQRSVIPVAGTTPAIPNLIRCSIRSDGIATPAVPSGASAVNSADDPSSNGRFVSLARWNSHYLVPKINTGDDGSEPVAAFSAPDWILVSRNGPAIQMGIGTTPGAINDSSNTNPSYVIGRYAYAVYDEGGLLDVNIAGYPYPSPSPVSTPLNLLTAVGRKGTIALADLTAMKLTAAGATASQPSLTKMVAWRNYATVQASGAFPNLMPSDQTEIPYLNYVVGSPPIGSAGGFLTVSDAHFNGRTDQAFLNRRQLIELFRALSGSFNMLQYLGTFSRERNVPTWNSGTAVLNQRFYLGNFARVVPNPAAAQMADIQKHFGLRWVAGSPGSAGPPITPATPGHWQYVGSSGTTMRDRIPGFSTSPEFFQLLNYAMNGTNSDDSTHLFTTLSIGAALIDQYDDSILSDPTTGTTTSMIEYNGGWAVGLENVDPARPSPSPQLSPFPSPFGMSPTPPPFVANYAMLNRPFRNVGELGYAFRTSAGPTATPASPRTIDFATAASSDAPILDLFTYNSASVRAGTINLNTQNVAVIAAILKSAITNESTSAVVGLAASNNAAASPTPSPTLGIVGDPVNGTMMRPATGRQDIARLVSAVGNTLGSTEEAKETVARALSEVSQTRTWVLMIDLVAQSGRYPPNATTLANFIVEGERRYWLHIAIDRFTGEVIDEQLEAVYD